MTSYNQDEIEAEIERRVEERLRPLQMKYERLKLDNEKLISRVEELEEENRKLKAKIYDIFFGPPDAVVTVDSD